MKFIITVSALFFLSSICTGQYLQDLDSILSYSKKDNKPVLLIFSGSDWCINCIRFEKRILSDPLFQSFANQQLLLLVADFPQRKKLPESIVKQNESLIEKYNPKGAFPALVLLSPGESKFITLEYSHETVQDFIAEVKKYLSAFI